MIVTMESVYGVNTMELDITSEQLNRVRNRYANGELIQDIVQHLKPAEREFLISGMSEEQWLDMFGSFE